MPNLTVCTCDPTWPAYAVCEVCAERNRLHRELIAKGAVRAMSSHPAAPSYAALIASHFGDDARLDACDLADRARDAADAWRMGRSA